jgi:hypothetical protein
MPGTSGGLRLTEATSKVNGLARGWPNAIGAVHTQRATPRGIVFGSEREFGETANWRGLERFALPGLLALGFRP